MDYSNLDSFVIYMCVEGRAVLVYNGTSYSLNKGETILLPAAINEVKLMANETSRVLEVYL